MATLCALAAAWPASIQDPPANDMLLHGHIAAGAAEALATHGWTAFQDPFIPGSNWGYPLLHAYPYLSHQLAAGLSVASGMDPFTAAGGVLALTVLLLPLGAWVGARWLGLTPERAALAALVAASMRCLDDFGHTPLSYSFEGVGLGPQALGGLLSALAVPALLAVGTPPPGSTLQGWSRGRRLALAAVLVSLVVRSHLVAGWIAPVLAGVLVVSSGRAGLEKRLGWLVAAGIGAGVLAAGFLLPFASDLSGVNDSIVATGGRSYGLVRVLRGLFGGGFLDGGPPGVWTVALGLALLGARRAASPVARPLAWTLLAIVLLMAGRETWGDWMDALPLIGRFHDQRYLLGVHLVVPWVIAASAPDGLRWVSARLGVSAPLSSLAARGALAIAAFLAVTGGAEQLRTARGAQDELAAWRGSIEPSVQELLADPRPGSVVATFRDGLTASTTPMSWLLRRGVRTVALPLHHYSHAYEFTMWLSQNEQTVAPRAAAALGASALLHRDGDRYRVEAVGGPFPDVAVVRSDLLMRSAGASLDGLAMSWWDSGAWLVGQHPAVSLLGREVDGPFVRTGSIDAPDPAVLQGLPARRGGAVLDGGTPIVSVGERRIRARADEDGQWLKVGMSWHPRIVATVDGVPTQTALLLPANLGVRLPRGEHEVVLSWQVPPWRGRWAALNVLLVLGLATFALAPRRR